MSTTFFPGFCWGQVIDIEDPLKMGRVRVKIPGMFDEGHPEWCIPVGWPGAGHESQGSRYPLPVDAQVAVFFEHGDPEGAPIVLGGVYPASKGIPAGPPIMAEAAQSSDTDVNNVVLLWEDDMFRCYVTRTKDDRRLVLLEKETNSNITLNATDGAQKKSKSITLEANTSISIHSNGIVDISGTRVQIQGRVVARKPGVTTI